MQIPIKMNKDFERQFKIISDKYGEDFELLNGFHESQLNFSDFIDGFVDKNVADVTIDGNANASHKDVCSLIGEKGKSEDKLFAFNKIFYELKKKYGLKTAKEWLETEYNGGFYLHDAPSATYKPYSYKGTELITVKYNDKILLCSFEQLYDLVDEEVVLLNEEDDAYCKYTNNLFVLDKGNTWTKVIRVIRKPKTNDFHFIKGSNGISEIVTSNHPVITKDGDKTADSVTNDDIIITESPNIEFGNVKEIFCLSELSKNGKPMYFKGELCSDANKFHEDGQISYVMATNPIQNRVVCDFDFGWLIGMIIAEGSYSNDNIQISQNKGAIFDKVISILEKRNYGYSIQKRSGSNCYNIKIRSLVFCDLITTCFCSRNLSYDKKLNPEILKYNKDFLKGIIGGVLDGDGILTQAQGRRMHVRMTSRTLINQLAYIVRMFGYTVIEQTPAIYRYNCEDASIKQKRYIYHMAFTPYCDAENFDSIKIRNHSVEYTSKLEEGKYTNGKYTFGFGDVNVTNNEVLIKDFDEFVYDISVETGHFMCNNILSHNCYAYDLSRLAREGLFFLENYNNQPPKHLTTFLDDVIEFVSFMSNRTSGACGLPNILLWTMYFSKKDEETGHVIKNYDYYVRQNFQKFIYRLNQPFLRVDQSAFTNVSIFDREYYEALFGGVEFPDGSFAIDYIDDFMEHQKVFMEVVSEIRSSNMFTFPVELIAA